ncbi:histone-lysine N-methyltransferase ash1 [Anopheles cruzii]|uniref:histone-lysine N-methyltransferase ash1 n=1 Tax=Anopheles cruzii TaxID=68878 RepID=UPI0022EC1AB3|nr:histone-lysine N-methyltransferase ash1 [Anopheles cruzii]
MTTVKSSSADTNPADNSKSPLSSSSSSSSSSDSDDGSDSSSDSDSSSASTSKTSSKKSSSGAPPPEKPQQFSVMSSDSAGLRMKIAIPRSQSNATPTPSPTIGGSPVQGSHQQTCQQPRVPSPADVQTQQNVGDGGGKTSSALPPMQGGPSASGSVGGAGTICDGKSAMMESAVGRAATVNTVDSHHHHHHHHHRHSTNAKVADGRKLGTESRTHSAKMRKRSPASGIVASSGRQKKNVSESDSSSPSSSYSSCTSNSDSDSSSTAGDQQQGSKKSAGRGLTSAAARTMMGTTRSGGTAAKKQKMLKRKKTNLTVSSSSSDEDDEKPAPSCGSSSRGARSRTNDSTDTDSSSSEPVTKAYTLQHPSKGAKKMISVPGAFGGDFGACGKDGLLTGDTGMLIRPPLSTSTPAKSCLNSSANTTATTLLGGTSVSADDGLTGDAEGGFGSSDNELPALVSAAIRRVESGSDAESIRGLSGGPTQQYTSSLLRDFVVKTQMLGSVGSTVVGASSTGGALGATVSGPASGGRSSPCSSSSSSSSSSGGSSSSTSSASSVDEAADPAIGSAGPGPGGGLELEVRKIKTESPAPSMGSGGGRSTPLTNGGLLTKVDQRASPIVAPITAPSPPTIVRRRGRPPKSSLAAVPKVLPCVVSESPDSGILSTHSSSGSPKTEKTKLVPAGVVPASSSRRNKAETRDASIVPGGSSGATGVAAAPSYVGTAPAILSSVGASGSGRNVHSINSNSSSTSYSLTSCLDRNTYATERVLYPPRSAKKRGVGRPPKAKDPAQRATGGGATATDDHLDPHWQKIDISKKFHEPRLSGYKSDGGHSTICCSKRLASQSGYISDYGGVATGGGGGGRSRLSGYKSDYSSRSRRSCRAGGGGYRSDYGRARSCGYRSDCSTRHRKQVRRKRRKKIATDPQHPQQQHHNNNVNDRKNNNAGGGAIAGGSKSSSVSELDIMLLAGLTLGSTSDEDSSSTSSSTSTSSNPCGADSRESLCSDPVSDEVATGKKAEQADGRRQRVTNAAANKRSASAVASKQPTQPVQAPKSVPRKAAQPGPGRGRKAAPAESEEEDEVRRVSDRRFRSKPMAVTATKPKPPVAAPPVPSVAATASAALKLKSSASGPLAGAVIVGGVVRRPGQRGRPPSVKKLQMKAAAEAAAAAAKSATGLGQLLAPKCHATKPLVPVNNFAAVFSSMVSGKPPAATGGTSDGIYSFSSSTVGSKNAFAAYLLRGNEDESTTEAETASGNGKVVKKLPLSRANVIKNSEECSRRFQKSNTSTFAGGLVGSIDLLARIADGTIPKAATTKSVCSKRSRRKSISDRLEVMSVKSHGVIGASAGGKIRQRRLSTMSRCSSRSAGSKHPTATRRRRKKRLRSNSVAPGATSASVGGAMATGLKDASTLGEVTSTEAKINLEVERLSESFGVLCRIDTATGDGPSRAVEASVPQESASATPAGSAGTSGPPPPSGKPHQSKRSVKKRKASEHVTTTESPSMAGAGGTAGALGPGGGPAGTGGTGKRRNKKSLPTQSPDDHKLPLKKRHYLLTPGEKGNNSDNNSGVDETGGSGVASVTSASAAVAGSHTVINPCAFGSGGRLSAGSASAAVGSTLSGTATKAVTPKKRHLLKSPEPGPVPVDELHLQQIKSSDSPLTIVNGSIVGLLGEPGKAGGLLLSEAASMTPGASMASGGGKKKHHRQQQQQQDAGHPAASSSKDRSGGASDPAAGTAHHHHHHHHHHHRSTPPSRPSVIQSSSSILPSSGSGPPPGVFEPTVDLELAIPPAASIPSLIAKVEMLDSPRLTKEGTTPVGSASTGTIATKLESADDLLATTVGQRKAGQPGASGTAGGLLATVTGSVSEKVLEKLLTKTGAHHLLLKKKRKKPNRTGFPTVKKKKKKLGEGGGAALELDGMLELKPELGPELFDSSNLTRHVPTEAERSRMREKEASGAKATTCERVPKAGEPTDSFIERAGVGRPRLSVVSLEKLQGKLPLGGREVATTPPATGGGRGRKSINPLASEHLQLAPHHHRGSLERLRRDDSSPSGRKGKSKVGVTKSVSSGSGSAVAEISKSKSISRSSSVNQQQHRLSPAKAGAVTARERLGKDGRCRSKSVSASVVVASSERLPNIVKLGESLAKSAAKENKENNKLSPARSSSIAVGKKASVREQQAARPVSSAAETTLDISPTSGVIRRTRSSSMALDPAEIGKLPLTGAVASGSASGTVEEQGRHPVTGRGTVAGLAAGHHNEDSTSLDSMPLLKRVHSRSISRLQSVITPSSEPPPVSSPKTPGRPRGRPRTTSPSQAPATPQSPKSVGQGRGRPRTIPLAISNLAAAKVPDRGLSPALSSPPVSPRTIAAGTPGRPGKKLRPDGRKSVPVVGEPIESPRAAGSSGRSATKSALPMTMPCAVLLSSRLKRGKSDETLREQKLAEKPGKKLKKADTGGSGQELVAVPSAETTSNQTTPTSGHATRANDKRGLSAAPIVEPIDPEETAHAVQPASSVEEPEHDPLPPDEGPSDFFRLLETPSPSASSTEGRDVATGTGSGAGGLPKANRKLPRKKYIAAGLFSDCYKDDGTGGGGAGPKVPPETLLPPPAYCERFLRRTVRDFQLPYDLWLLQENGKLPGRSAVPSWNYRKIRTNVYYDVKSNPSTDNPQCNCRADSGCGDDCLNRMVYTECVPEHCPCGDRCENTSIQRHEYAPGLERFMTEEKGWGIRSKEPIRKGTFIMEYLGEVVTEKEFKERMRSLYLNDTHHYCLNLDGGLVIDGHRMGSDCRFVNHSCAPNCEMQKWSVNGLFRMALFAGRDIHPYEELCYDYNFSLFNPSEGQPCRCGSEQCRGVIGGKSQRIKPVPLLASGLGMAEGANGEAAPTGATAQGGDATTGAGSSSSGGALVVELSPRSAARSRKRQAKKNQPMAHLNGAPIPTFHPPTAKERGLIVEHHCFLLRNLNKIRKQKERTAALASAAATASGTGTSSSASGLVSPGQELGGTVAGDQANGGPGKPSLASQISALRCPRNIRTRGLAFVEDDPELEKTARIAVALKEICIEIATLKDEKGHPYIAKLQLPSKKKTPLYYERIPKPIDLGQIEASIEQGAYRLPKAFEDDLLIMLSNAIKYFGISSPEGVASEALKSHYYTCKAQQVPKLQAYIGEDNELLRGFVPKKEPDETVPPKSKRGRRQEQPEDIIRCICGLFKDEGLMIQCSKCLVWQHIECTKADPNVDNYLCERCEPRTVNYEIPLNEFTEEGYQYYVSLMRGSLQIRQTDTVYVLRDIPMDPDPADGPGAPVRKHTYETIGKIEYSECDIFRVESLWKDGEGRRFVYGHHYLRPHETYHEPTRRFYPNEVMRVPLYEVIPIELVVDRCWVLDPVTFCKGRPVDSAEPHVYICELRVDKSARLFSKISRHSHPVCMKSYAFHKFEQKLKIAKTFAPHDLGSLAHLLSIRDKQKKGSRKDDGGTGGQTVVGLGSAGGHGIGGNGGGSHSIGSKKMTPIVQLLPPPPKTESYAERSLAPLLPEVKVKSSKTLAEKRNRLEQVLSRLMQKLALNPGAVPVVDISYLLTGRGARLRRTNNSTPVPII